MTREKIEQIKFLAHLLPVFPQSVSLNTLCLTLGLKETEILFLLSFLQIRFYPSVNAFFFPKLKTKINEERKWDNIAGGIKK